MNGAGGTSGGIGRFFIGLIMMIAGGYLFLDAVHVTNAFTLHKTMYSFGKTFNLTGGMIFVPFIFGIGFLFYSSKSIVGWVLTVGSMTMLVFGIISNVGLRLESMTAFELITILVLLMGGIGLFLSSLKEKDVKDIKKMK